MAAAPISTAMTIREQLGGGRFSTMTGARDFVAINGNIPDAVGGLQCKIMRNPQKVTHVQVILLGNDTYTVRFLQWKSHRMEFNQVGLYEDVYADNLREIFTKGTGLQTSLASR